jgi:hypothetical protein
MSDDRYYLRYRRDTVWGERFGSIRYPWRRNVTRAEAEHVLAAMPTPENFEIVEEN